MAYFLFLDESGHDHQASPYEVLAGVAVEDRNLWSMVLAVQEAELRCFGCRYSAGRQELKGKKLLKRKTFRLAEQLAPMAEGERRIYAKACLENGESAGKREITALAQAKLAYVSEVLDICARFDCRAFASIVQNHSSRDLPAEMLRRDYCYLFERFFYLLEDRGPNTLGVIVFDELEKSQSHLLLGQMDRYFKRTAKGRRRASQIIPEAFFVHSDLTTGIQLSDLVAYLVSWGFRDKRMELPRREELDDFVYQVCRMRYKTQRKKADSEKSFVAWSFVTLSELAASEVETQ